MKFCKSLQRVVEISDPAYSAFFVNYRMLSKLNDIVSIPRMESKERMTWNMSPCFTCMGNCVLSVFEVVSCLSRDRNFDESRGFSIFEGRGWC